MISYLKTKPVLGAIAAALAIGTPAATVTAPTAAVAAQGDLDRAVTALRGISTMKADFTQTDRQGQTVAGKLTLKRPGKIRFQYEDGVPLLLVSNGKSLTLIDYEVNQVQRWPISNSPLGALLDSAPSLARAPRRTQRGRPQALRSSEASPEHATRCAVESTSRQRLGVWALPAVPTGPGPRPRAQRSLKP